MIFNPGTGKDRQMPMLPVSKTILCPSPEALPQVAKEVIRMAGNRRVICLTGDLGAGKTALVTALVKALGSTDIVSSPTFALVQDYLSDLQEPPVIHHIDAYRLTDLNEALDIGILETLDDPAWTFIEWPEVLTAVLPENRLDIDIQILPDSTREIVILER
ncbi:MAG: tRNA (adenosine(37)-N6)-threonylcarbamoyltransferase complex ATPase subunit type 1 TsaE [Saprospiraceae bacterium]|nr:tRNA (adenosine(37)-N6)-threonylcarbamoyltransferase complex ATPase subunit type 1 TsaE [Saprospiraceae bacterium]